MNVPYVHAPHAEGRSASTQKSDAPNAALLIDFDNVTMGMRSDLSKEFKKLLSSDIIRGKVTVQRAYADWRRYPQYIVPLSEASIDLIFAPAYGSSKKNATDIRMAIDGMELVFIRPEIGTYILLTGDSDFSSLVLKLKEYGKYVIGVGIQESKSDILVQNCDEYYSYTAITGLRKSDESDRSSLDPWVLVEKAAQQMASRGDVMRSDRLKQVMLELDPGFDEGSYGFSRFSRFLTEASSKGLLRLKKLDNGQYEIAPGEETASEGGEATVTTEKEAPSGDGRRGRRQRDDRGGRSRRGRKGRDEESAGRSQEGRRDGKGARGREGGQEEEREKPTAEASELSAAYDLLKRAVAELADDAGDEGVRDSDVKRRMLALNEGFDEAEYGFSKFTRFLRQAHDEEVVDLHKTEDGSYWVRRREDAAAEAKPKEKRPDKESPKTEEAAASEARPEPRTEEPERDGREAAAAEAAPSEGETAAERKARLRPRQSRGPRGRRAEGPPPLLEGQARGGAAPRKEKESVPSEEKAAAEPRQETPAEAAPESGNGQPREPAGEPLDPKELKLPTDPKAVVQYMANSYAGVGTKTAETLVEHFGADVFRVLQVEPEKVRKVLPGARAGKVLDAWEGDLSRRRARLEQSPGEGDGGGDGDGAKAESGGKKGGGGGDGGNNRKGSGGGPRRRTRKRGSSGGGGGGR